MDVRLVEIDQQVPIARGDMLASAAFGAEYKFKLAHEVAVKST
jgi:hypothetical protein